MIGISRGSCEKKEATFFLPAGSGAARRHAADGSVVGGRERTRVNMLQGRRGCEPRLFAEHDYQTLWMLVAFVFGVLQGLAGR